jgi:hypothetical protein
LVANKFVNNFGAAKQGAERDNTFRMIGYCADNTDPLYLANEGTLVCVVAAIDADKVLATMQQTKEGKDACIIGTVTNHPEGIVALSTLFGGSKPRISQTPRVGVLTGKLSSLMIIDTLESLAISFNTVATPFW